MIDSKESEVMWRILFCCYLANFDFRSNINEYIKTKRIFIEKLSKLPESLFKKKNRIICKAIAKNWKNKRNKQKAFNILKLLYFILVINHKLSIFMVRKQEICNRRTLKRKIFRIFWFKWKIVNYQKWLTNSMKKISILNNYCYLFT